MGYVGNQTSNSYTSLAKQTITGNGGTGYTLDHAVANAQEIEVFVNNVRQEPAVAYTVSGTTLTMTGNVASTDDFYVVFQGKAIQTVVPPDDSVTTARINDDAVTNAKIADDAVDTAQIAANAVTSAKMFSGFANGVGELDVWYRTTSDSLTSAVNEDLTASWARWTTNWEKIGTGMSEASGIFTFPSTGKWHIVGNGTFSSNGSRDYMGIKIMLSTDSGSTYSIFSSAYNASGSGADYVYSHVECFLDVTDTSTMKIKFKRQTDGTGTHFGGNTQAGSFWFAKIADT